MVTELLNDNLKSRSLDYGLAGGLLGEKKAYIAIGHITLNSIEDFWNFFEPNAATIMSNLPNFTNLEPQIQISGMKI